MVSVAHRVGTYAEGVVLDADIWLISVADQLYHLIVHVLSVLRSLDNEPM